MGSFLKLCLVVEGEVYFYFCLGLIFEWDIGVVYVVVLVVGVNVIVLDGVNLLNFDVEVFIYNQKEFVLNFYFFVSV